MNKRIRKKLEKKKVASIPFGYGIIIGKVDYSSYNGRYIVHYHPVGALVKIDKVEPDRITCTNPADELCQTVSPEHILMNI